MYVPLVAGTFGKTLHIMHWKFTHSLSRKEWILACLVPNRSQ